MLGGKAACDTVGWMRLVRWVCDPCARRSQLEAESYLSVFDDAVSGQPLQGQRTVLFGPICLKLILCEIWFALREEREPDETLLGRHLVN